VTLRGMVHVSGRKKENGGDAVGVSDENDDGEAATSDQPRPARPLSAAELAEFRRQFREQYGLDGEFAEAFSRWGQAGGAERISSFVGTHVFDVRGFIQRRHGVEAARVIQDAIGSRPLDAEEIAVSKALRTVEDAIEEALKLLGPHLGPRQMRTNPDPAAALMIAQAVLGKIGVERKPRRQGRPTKQRRNSVVEVMAKAGYAPAKITRFLRAVGYSESEASERNVAATIQKLERAGQKIPVSPTARNRTREKHRKPR
jgi:hypothetical protein